MERIHVTLRSRPLSAEDAKTSPWKVSGNSIFVPNHPSKFEFDSIFGEDCKTKEVYQARTKEIVAAAVCGFNGTVFAYGQTNSGKTHTMRGSPNEPGIIPLSVHDLFDIIQQDIDREFLLRMSYMEIYNEEINDLLAPEHRKLQIHESLERGIYVAGLREEIVASPEQVLDLMEFGESHRHIGETNMNLYSSRSHTIFRMIIESRDKSEDEDIGSSCDAVRVSVLNLVDLAGSERAAKTGAEGVRLKEGSHINKSLMTLGTVIKKLSEGAESQGGHVPYRDSKLTRILQPALGGNANTAIICNITLALIHADETKSSLQFASRALRVTNCAHVNEILTDAALLKRQKKEIEELRAKLQGSHSEHLEEEILNLRNTLLQTELERERIALQLEEEKKAQAEWEKMVQEQAKKIENLSSIVLYSNRDDNRDRFRKEKRRDTWCPGNLSKEPVREVYSTIQSISSAMKQMRPERDMGPLLPFEELVDEVEVSESDFFKQDENCENYPSVDCNLPDPYALLHVTNRRKAPRKKSLPGEESDYVDIQAAYEDLLLKFESQKTMSDIQIDCLTRKLAEVDWLWDLKCHEKSKYHVKKGTVDGDKSISLRESEAILVIKRLQEQIKILEMEKSSSQQNLDNIVDLATVQNVCVREKFEELSEELLSAREEARVAHEKLTSTESNLVNFIQDGDSDFVHKLSSEVEGVISEVEHSKRVVGAVSSLIVEISQSFSGLFDIFLDFKTSIHESSQQQKIILSNHEKLSCQLMQKVSELENEKLRLYNQSVDLQKQIEVLRQDAENSEKSLSVLSEKQGPEHDEYVAQIQILEKEISYFSSSSLFREKESLRKDLEKTRVKLKETEAKLKNVMQDKTKLEGEKAVAEREIKRFQGQKSLLERDISKRDSLAGRRHDSIIDRSSKVLDPKRAKSLAIPFEQMLQEDYKKLEVFAFELETKIASLEEELEVTNGEKEEVLFRNEALVSEVEALSIKLDISSLELNALQEEVSTLRQTLEENCINQKKLESSLKLLEEEKEELAMQLTESLLAMEEERAIWSSKEKDCTAAMDNTENLHKMEIISLSKELLEVRNDLENCQQECKVLREELACFEENPKGEKEYSFRKSLEKEKLIDGKDVAYIERERAQELKSDLEVSDEKFDGGRGELLDQNKEFDPERESIAYQLLLVRERDSLMTQIQELQNHASGLELLEKRRNEIVMETKDQVEKLTARISSMEIKMHRDGIQNNNEKAKLRMRLRGSQAKLDAFRIRYKEATDESEYMNIKFEEASGKLKDRLAAKGVEVLNLKKQLAGFLGR